MQNGNKGINDPPEAENYPRQHLKVKAEAKVEVEVEVEAKAEVKVKKSIF